MTTEKPFIHLFESPYGHYIFDVNTNTLLGVKESAYKLLQKEMIGANISSDTEDYEEAIKIKSELLNKGYLLPSQIKEIEHPANDILENRLNNAVEKITLQVTQQCNLRCRYCIYSGAELQRSHSNKRMDFHTAKKCIDFLISHSKHCPYINIGFYGGEPLLEFNLIKKCIEYSVEHAQGKDITFNITSNATLLTKEIVEFLSRYDVSLAISLDGPKEIHDKNRRFAASGCGSFDKIMENLENIKSVYPDYFKKIIFSIVLDPESSFTCTNEFFLNYDALRSAHVIANVADDRYSREKNIFSSNFIEEREYEIFKTFLFKLNRLSNKHISPISMELFNDIKKVAKSMQRKSFMPAKAHHGGPCVPGELRLFVSYDGYFYPCERVSESSEVMRIGHIDSGFDFDKVRALLNIGKLTENQCKNCWIFRSCGLCAAHADNIVNLSAKRKGIFCSDMRMSTEENFKDYISLKELGYNFQWEF